MADLKAIAEQLVNLTVKDVSELAKIMEEQGAQITRLRHHFRLSEKF